jgi:non-homologous end joining protein Ku
MLELAKHIINTKKGSFDAKAFDECYEEAVAELVKAKIEGRPLPKKQAPAPTKTSDLLQALRQNAGMGSRRGPKRAAAKGDGPPRAVMLEPRGKGVVVWTLRYGDEVRDENAYFGGIDDRPSDSQVMPLIQQLIKKQTRHWDSKLVADPVQDKLLEIIEAKRKKTKRPAKAKASEPKATANNVISIMDALRKSLEAEKRPGKR